MKLGILTHPLLGNYGGLLQAYALVKALCNMGHDAYVLSYMPESYKKTLKNPFKRFKERFRIFLLKHNLVFSDFKTPLILQIENGMSFERNYVPSLWIDDDPGGVVEANEIDAVVVGSDQVWRGDYARPMKSYPFFFLDFVKPEVRRRSIAYAASFGTEVWTGDEEETRTCGGLLREFRAVSVREASGVDICCKHLGVEAVWLPDPTLLLNPLDYTNLLEQEETRKPHEEYIATYLLDNTEEIKSLVAEVSTVTGLPVQSMKAETTAANRQDRFPVSVAQWLRYLRDCKYMITDSFHGCVFSIIFNKPFVCLGNKKRGTTRFLSLFSVYGLESRLVDDVSAASVRKVLDCPIDWELVNRRREKEREKGLQFITEFLSPHS